MLRLIPGAVILLYVADIFQEQHRQNAVFVDAGIDHPPEGIIGAPGGFVDLGLENGGHALVPVDAVQVLLDEYNELVWVKSAGWIIGPSLLLGANNT